MLFTRNVLGNLGLRLVAALACASALVGCAAKKKPIEWAPPPRTDWVNVSFVSLPPVDNAYQILVPQPTRGLFPASMAITRVAILPAAEEEPEDGPHLFADPKNEFLQWNRTVDDQMAVSEVFPIAQRDLGGREATPVQILAAFRALDARLGLIYAVNELSPTETEMFGTLYDTTSAQPIAALHARAVSRDPPKKKKDESKKPAADPWKTDSRALVRAKFDRLVHACVRDLILHDEPERTDVPPGWTRPPPVRPAEWPPANFSEPKKGEEPPEQRSDPTQ